MSRKTRIVVAIALGLGGALTAHSVFANGQAQPNSQKPDGLRPGQIARTVLHEPEAVRLGEQVVLVRIVETTDLINGTRDFTAVIEGEAVGDRVGPRSITLAEPALRRLHQALALFAEERPRLEAAELDTDVSYRADGLRLMLEASDGQVAESVRVDQAAARRRPGSRATPRGRRGAWLWSFEHLQLAVEQAMQQIEQIR